MRKGHHYIDIEAVVKVLEVLRSMELTRSQIRRKTGLGETAVQHICRTLTGRLIESRPVEFHDRSGVRPRLYKVRAEWGGKA